MFNKKWERDPEFSSWVTGVPGDRNFAKCTICNSKIAVNGKTSLKRHADGIKHIQKMENRTARAAPNRPRPAAPNRPGPAAPNRPRPAAPSRRRPAPIKSSNIDRVPSQMSSGLRMDVRGMMGPCPLVEVNVINTNRHERDSHPNATTSVRKRQVRTQAPVRTSPGIQPHPRSIPEDGRPGVNQLNTNRHEGDSHPSARSPVRTRQYPGVQTQPRSVFEDGRSGEGAGVNEFVEKVEKMLSQHDRVIRGDISNFLDSYKQFLNERFRIYPSTSSSHSEWYISVRTVLDEYRQQYETLRKKIKTRLVPILSRQRL